MRTRRNVIAGNNNVRKALEQERASKLGINPDFETEFVLERDGDLPLRFWGDLIGEATYVVDTGGRGTRGTEVSLYVTSSGRIVTQVRQWKAGGERNVAAAHATPQLALDWLKKDAGGKLGKTSLAA